MRKNISIVLAIAVLMGYMFLTRAIHNRRDADRIVAVFNAERQANRNSSTILMSGGKPVGQTQFDFSKFAAGVHAIDTQECPGDFRSAWTKFTAALDAVATKEKQKVVNPSDLGEKDPALIAFKAAFFECEQIAARHGVTFH